MVRGKGTGVATPPKELLSQTEIATLNDEKRDLQSTLNELKEADGSSRAGSVDTIAIQGKIKHIDRAIEDRVVHDIMRGAKKDSIIREERDIEDRLVIGMPTAYEMDHPSRCPGAVRKHMAWNARNDALIRRYVEIQKILRPLEPKSIESLRKEK